MQSRVALALAKIPFEDHRIEFAEWPALKPKTPYGQLPVMRIREGGNSDDIAPNQPPLLPFRGQSRAMLHWIGCELAPHLYPKGKVLDIEEAIGIIDDLDRTRFPAFYMNRRPDMFGLPFGWNQSEEGKTILKNLHDKVLTEAIPTFAKHITDKLERNGGTWLASTDGPTLADCLAVPFLRSFTNGYIRSAAGETAIVNDGVKSADKKIIEVVAQEATRSDAVTGTCRQNILWRSSKSNPNEPETAPRASERMGGREDGTSGGREDGTSGG
jgi:hypothetical protein